jgi:hypothetical protein
MISYKQQVNMRSSQTAIARKDEAENENVKEYEYQQTIKEEKDLQYESTSLIETLGTLREMLTIDEYQENLLITMKDI